MGSSYYEGSVFCFRMLQLLKRSLWKVSFGETQLRFIHRSMVKKGHVTLVMYESILMRVSMIFNEFFSSNCYPGQIIPWGEINIKSNSITLYPLLDFCSQCEKTHQVLEIYKRHVASGGMDATVAWWETGGWQQRWGCWALWCNQWWPSWGAWMSRWKLVNGL